MTDYKRRYDELTKQEEDIKFYKDCVVDKYLEEIRNTILVEMPFKKDLFINAWHGDKDAVSVINKVVKSYFNTKKVDKITIVGYEMYEIEFGFKMDNKNWTLVVPIRQNIEKKHLISYSGGINWYIGNYRLCERISDSYSKCVWQGMYLKDCMYCKNENENENEKGK